jgi:2-polyprenyl-6-methoxyphenol hydroxylase-like FAD-dependent oxidoreductase
MTIVVAGAGPAGVATAKALADLGHAVTLLAVERRQPAVEGLSFRVLEGLRVAGLGAVLETLGRPIPRRVRWNGEDQAIGEEWVVERGEFDAALLDAVRPFVEIRAAALDAVEPSPGGVAWSARLAGSGRIRQEARFLVDARGRGTPGGLPRAVGPRTVALCRRHSLPRPLGPGTWVESGPSGWAWLAARGGEEAYLQVTVDGRAGALPGRAGLAAHLDEMLGEFPGMTELLGGTVNFGPVVARLAGAAIAVEPVGEAWLRVGDAALALDPLSGHGVFEAIGGAFAAAAVVNTILGRPADAALARRFYRDRVHATFRARALAGQLHYRREARWPDSRFWAERQAWPGPELEAPGKASTVETRAVIDQGWIREARVIVTPDQPRGVWRLDGVPVVRLLELTAAGRSAEEGAETLGCSVASVRSALSWLDRTGLLHAGLSP